MSYFKISKIPKKIEKIVEKLKNSRKKKKKDERLGLELFGEH